MLRREFLILCLLASGVLLVVAVTCSWIGYVIRKDATDIARDTIPGLADAGAAMAMTQENWCLVHEFGHCHTTAERESLANRIRTNSNERLWKDYSFSIYDSEDRRGYESLENARTNYIQVRERFFALGCSQISEDLQPFLEQDLRPAYEKYRSISAQVFDYNAKLGRQRAARVLRITWLAPAVLAVSGVVIFGFGVLAGLRGALTGLHLASRFGRK